MISNTNSLSLWIPMCSVMTSSLNRDETDFLRLFGGCENCSGSFCSIFSNCGSFLNFLIFAIVAEVWWCPGRLLDWMPPYQILVLSSGVWWSLLLDIRCLWRRNMTSYSRLQTNVLAKFVDATCIFRDAEAVVRQGEQ